ncbi:MAG: LPS export ABC transporter permease LptF [Chromatiales bacterium]
MILRRYLFREIAMAFGGVFVLLLLIFLSRSMVEYLADVASGKLPVNAILGLLTLLVISKLSTLIPVCLFVAVLFALGRMQRDNELVAMAGAGVGGRYLHQQIGGMAALVAILMALCSLFLGPWATREMKRQEAKAEQESDITGITPGRFKEFSEGDRVLFVKSLSSDKQTMEEVFLQIRDTSSLGVLAADRAALATEEGTGHRFVVFSDGSRYQGIPGRADYEITYYEQFGVRIDRGGTDRTIEGTKAMPSSVLWGNEDPTHVAELQWRISVPILTLLLSLFPVSLLRRMGADSRYGALLIAILVYFTCSNALGIARSLVEKGELSEYIGLWWVHLLLLAVILGLEFYPGIRRRLRRRHGGQQLLQRA